MNLTLSDLQVGDTAKVVAVDGREKFYRRKLLSMGMTPGIEFQVVRTAPMGDPIEICVRGFSLSLRKDEARVITIERIIAGYKGLIRYDI